MLLGVIVVFFFFFKQKTAYEITEGDWSSDVCSSDLTQAIRQDAVQRSQAVTSGKVHEQLVPYLPEFGFNPKDARFLGSPVDLLVFDGLDDGELRRVVFIEIKTGGSALTGRERQLRDVVRARQVAWEELRIER